MEIVKAHIAWKCRASAVEISPCSAMGGGPTQRPMAAKPSFVIVQHRAPCLCNADPRALIPVQCRSRCHDLHTLGPPHPFLPMAVPTQPCAKRCKICIRELICVEDVLADCHQHAKHSPSWWESDCIKQRNKYCIPSA